MPDLITDDQLREIREALSKATPAPWRSGVSAPCITGVWGATPEANWNVCWTGDEMTRHSLEDADLIAKAPEWLAALCDEVERLKESERAFAEELGYGDGKTEPAATLAELIDPLMCALSDGRDHMECPIRCELCGEMLASTQCPQCNGGGCLPNEALTYKECDTCAGAGRIHEGCAEQSYADLVSRAEKAEAALGRVGQVLAEHPGSAWDSGIKLQAALKAALDGE